MTPCKPNARRHRTFFRCGWLRVFGLLLFAYGVNHAAVHLALEAHEGELRAGVHAADAQPADFTATGHEDASHHVPHLASDHSLRLAAQARVSVVSVDLCAIPTSVEACRTEPRKPPFLTERQNPPGRLASGPTQPRAPPLA